MFQTFKRKADNPKNSNATPKNLNRALALQDKQIAEIQAAEKKFEMDGDINSLIAFWENIWKNGGLLFNGSKWAFRLPDIYIKRKQYDDALRILKLIRTPQYQDKKKSYMEKVQAAKAKSVKKK